MTTTEVCRWDMLLFRRKGTVSFPAVNKGKWDVLNDYFPPPKWVECSCCSSHWSPKWPPKVSQTIKRQRIRIACICKSRLKAASVISPKSYSRSSGYVLRIPMTQLANQSMNIFRDTFLITSESSSRNPILHLPSDLYPAKYSCHRLSMFLKNLLLPACLFLENLSRTFHFGYSEEFPQWLILPWLPHGKTGEDGELIFFRRSWWFLWLKTKCHRAMSAKLRLMPNFQTY